MTFDLIGIKLGDFEVVRELGRGGMGVVYEAVQTSLNRRVALKVLAPGLDLAPRAATRFRREAEAAAKLHHANIVPVFATGEQDGMLFYAMELIAGLSLDVVIRRLRTAPAADMPTELDARLAATGPHVPAGLTPAPTASRSGTTSVDRFDLVAAQVAGVADALHHAHQHGVTHRDIKPSNLLLSPDGRVSVTDFGLAQVLEQPGLTLTGEFVGTPAYMSPEQITAGRVPVDHRTDVYSLGATLYELLTLRVPFTADGRDRLLAMVIQQEPPPPRSIDPKIPRDLEKVCLKCLEKDPGRRYQTAGELADDLRRFLSRFAVRARRAGPLARAWRLVKRKPALAAAAAAALVALCVAGFFAWQGHAAGVKHKEEIRAERLAGVLEKAVTAALNGRSDEAELRIAEAEDLGAHPGEVSKVRGIIALYQNDAGRAVAHLEMAAECLGSSVAVKALLARAYQETADVRQSFVTDLRSIEPRTPEDFLFRGQMIAHFDDPQLGLQDVREASRLRPSPLALLILAEVRIQIAVDTGLEEDAKAAVEDANVARRLLPDSDLALGVCLEAHLLLWDVYGDRKARGDAERAASVWAAAGGLVEAAGWRSGWKLQYAVSSYHRRSRVVGASLAYNKGVWERNPGDPLAGEFAAAEMFRAGDAGSARNVLAATLARRGSRSNVEWYLWACLKAESGLKGDAYSEAAAQPRSPFFVLMLPPLAQLLGKQKEARNVCVDALKAGSVPVWHRGWYLSLACYGASEGGPNDEKAILERAGKSRMNRCEAHFHVAMCRLGRGDKKGARDHLELTVQTRVCNYNEHNLADIFLTRMQSDPDWPAWVARAK